MDKLERSQHEQHRHMLCLYGQDADMLRFAAIRLRISVSALIRLSLRLYLKRLAMKFHSKRIDYNYIFWRGIKRYSDILLTAKNQLTLPWVRNHFYQSFCPGLRWKWPAAPG